MPAPPRRQTPSSTPGEIAPGTLQVQRQTLLDSKVTRMAVKRRAAARRARRQLPRQLTRLSRDGIWCCARFRLRKRAWLVALRLPGLGISTRLVTGLLHALVSRHKGRRRRGKSLTAHPLQQARRLWKDCAGSMVVVEAGTPMGFANVERVRALVLEQDASDCTVVAPCPHDAACPLSSRAAALTAALPSPRGRVEGDTSTGSSLGAGEGEASKATSRQGGEQASKASSWCHFTQRISVPSFQKAVEGGPRAKKRAFVDWKFSYVALSRKHLISAERAAAAGDVQDGEARRCSSADASSADASSPPGGGGEPKGDVVIDMHKQGSDIAVNWGRVVRWPMKRSGHVVLDLCSAEGGMERRVVAKSHGAAGGYRRARELGWGDVFPFDKFDKAKHRDKKLDYTEQTQA